MSSKILLRRGTAAEWSSANPILGTGELGIETDTLKIKIGNGSSTWSQLSSYANVTPAQLTSQINSLISAAPATLDTLNELAAAINNDASFSTTVNNLLTGKVSKSGGDTITASTASTVGLIVKGAASQTADLQQWQNSAGEVQVSIKPTSNLTNVLKFTEQYSFAINWGNEAILSTSSGELVVSPYGPDRAALIVKGKASQTDNLQEWQNSSGTVLASVSSVGNFYVGNTFSNFGGQTINGGYVTIAGSLPAIKPLLIRGAASQTANLQEWQRSDGAILSSVSSDGTTTLGSMQITAGTHKAYGPFEILNNAAGNSIFSVIGSSQGAYGSLTIGIKNTDNANNRNWRLLVGGGGFAGQSGNYIGEGGLVFTENNPNDSSSADRAGFRRGGQFALGGLNTYSASLSVTPLSTSTIGQVIRANASQTANLQEWQQSDGSATYIIDANGHMYASGSRGLYLNTGFIGDTRFAVASNGASQIGMIIRGSGSQTANLTEWRNGSDAVLAKVDSAGSITATNYNLSNSLYNIKKTLKKTIDPAQNAIAGNTYDLFQIQFSSSLQGIFTMQVSIRNGGYGQSMSYTLPVTYVMDWLSQYGITNPFTDSSTWVDLTPITFAPRHLMTNDYLKFQARVNNNTIFFRIKLTGQLTSNPLFDVYIQHSEEFANSTVTELSSTGTDFTTSGVLPNFLSSKAGTTAIFNPLTITSSVAANVPLIAKGAASQTGDLTQWQNSVGTVLSVVDSAGRIVLGRGSQLASATFTIQGNTSTYSPDNTSALANRIIFLRGNTGGNLMALTSKGDAAQGVAALVITNGGFSTEITGFGYNGNIYTNLQSASTVGLTIKGAISQTANLQEWQNSSGTVLAKVESTGIFNVNNIANSTLTTALVMDNSGVGTGTGTQIIFRYGGGNYASISSVYSGSPTGPDMIFNVGSTGAARMRIDNRGTVTINGFQADAQGLIIKGFASQTANLQEWQNSFGTVTSKINSSGDLGVNYITSVIGGGSQLSFTNNAEITAYTDNAARKVLVVKAFASQTANLTEWQNSNGTVLVSISSDGVINKTGTTNIGPVLTFANPGVGQDTRFNFTKSSDAAWLSVVERSSDNTYYEFGMSDNPTGGDYFQWKFDNYESAGQGWMPIQIGAMATRFTSAVSNWGSYSIPANTPFTTLNASASSSTDFQVNKYFPTNNTAQVLNKDSGSGTGTVTLNAQSFTGTARLGYWITIESGGTTFSWGNGFTASTPIATGVAITGSAQTLSNGVSITLSLTNHVAGDRWSFLCFPRPTVGIGGDPLLTSMHTVYTAAAVVGSIIRAATSQTANLQEWQDSAGTIRSYIQSDGRFVSTLPIRTNSVGAVGVIDQTIGQFTIFTDSATRVGLGIKGAASQTADLQQWQNSAGTVMAHINSIGTFTNRMQIYADNTQSGSFSLVARTNYGTVTPVSIQAAASQTADLTQWVNSANTVLASISSSGNLLAGDISVGNSSAYGVGSFGTGSNSIQQLLIANGAAGRIGLIVKGAASQTANLQEWQNSSGTVLSRVDSGGIGRFTYFRIGSTLDGLYTTSISNPAANLAGLAIRGADAQTANLTEWQNSAGTVLAKVQSGGEISSLGFISTYNSYMYSGDATATPLRVIGTASQTGDLQRWQNSSGTVLTKIESGGAVNISPTSTPNGYSLYLIGAGSSGIVTMKSTATSAHAIQLQNSANTVVFKMDLEGRIVPSSASSIGLIIRGADSQTANLQEWQDSSANVLLSVSGNTANMDVRTIGNFYLRTSNNNSINIQPYVSAGGPAATFTYNSIVLGTQAPITAASATAQAIIVKGFASQTANLQEWQNSSGTVLARVDSNGSIYSGLNLYVSNAALFTTSASNYYNATVSIDSQGAAYSGLVIRGRASQTANLQEWQNNSGTVLAKITASGALDVTAITVNGAAITSTPSTSDVELMNIMGAY